MIDFNQFYKDNYEKHKKKIARIINGDTTTAEDIVQEAYMRAWKYRDSYDRKRSGISTWFNTILYNTLRDFQKSFKDNQEDSGDVDRFYEEENLKSIAVHLPVIEREIKKMKNERIKRVLTLYYILGYTSTEISQVEADTTVTNVTTICNRFRKKLRAY